MSALSEFAEAFGRSLLLGRKALQDNGMYQAADAVLKLKSAFDIVTTTTDPDNGNVLPGFEDRNATARQDMNDALGAVASVPLAVLSETAVAAGFALLFTGGAAAAPFLVVGLVGGLAALATDFAVAKTMRWLSSYGITVTGQAVDYSSYYPDPSLGSTTGLKIVGSTAADTIKTTKFDDTVFSSWFGDTIYNPGGSDKIDGGLGYDTVSYAEHNSGIVFYGSSLTVSHSFIETDTLISVEQIDGSSKGDNFEVATGNVNNMTLNGLGGDDTFAVIGPAFRVNINGGGSTGDALDMRGSGMSFVIADLSGTVAGAGSDVELHLTGIHTYYGIEKEDWVTGSEEADIVYAENGRNKVFALGGDDIVHGGSDFDSFYGGGGNDKLYGEGGSDHLIGGAESDTLIGGAGDDILIAGNIDGSANSNAQDVVNGGAGRDYLVLTASGGSTVTVQGGDKNDRLLIHSSLLGEGAPGGQGQYSLFQLRGGVFLKVANAVEGQIHEQIGGLVDANRGEYEDGTKFRVWYYSTKPFVQPTYIQSGLYVGFSETDPSTDPWGKFGPGSGTLYEDVSLPFLIEYNLNETTRQLDVFVMGSVGSDGDGGRALLETIVIENFRNGDYGIELNEVYDPYTDVGLGFYNPTFYEGGDASTPGSAYYFGMFDGTDSYADSYDRGIVGEYSADVKHISEQKFGLTVEGDVMQNARMMAFAEAASEPDLSSMELIITITGGSGNDSLQGFDVKERISGGDGNDAIRGDGGDDEIFGEAGNDRIYGGAGADLIDGGEGTDTVDYRHSTAAVNVDLALFIGAGGDAEGDLIFAVENVAGSAFNDTLTGDESVNRLVGGDGNDTLNGSGGDDILIGGLGSDVLIGGAGAKDAASYQDASAGVVLNLVTGGTGGEAAGDTYSGIEYVYGSAFNDTIVGNDAVNRLLGNDGNDVLDGGAGNDVLIGGQGADTLIGGAGDQDAASYQDAQLAVIVNLALGGSGGDAAGDTYNGIEYVYGSAFNDQIIGDGAINRLVGGAGNDSLDGAAGNDYLLGDAGNDVLVGGAGADVFVFNASFGDDTISDFWAGVGRTDRAWFQGVSGIANYADVLSHAADSAAGVVISVAGQGSLTLAGVSLAQLNADDFLFG